MQFLLWRCFSVFLVVLIDHPVLQTVSAVRAKVMPVVSCPSQSASPWLAPGAHWAGPGPCACSPLPAARLAPGLTRQRLARSRPQGLGPNPETRPDPRSAPRAGPLPRLQLALTSAGRLLNVRCPSWTAVTLFLFCCCLLAGNSKLCPETPRATRSAFLKGTQLLRSRPRAPRPGLSVLVVLLRVFPGSVINF